MDRDMDMDADTEVDNDTGHGHGNEYLIFCQDTISRIRIYVRRIFTKGKKCNPISYMISDSVLSV
jgi:hypothetical protein